MIEVWIGTKINLMKKEISRRNKIIFNYKFIRIDGHTYFDEKMILRNIYRLHHIVDIEGNIKSCQEFQRMGLDRVDINKIKQIFEHLPSSWKQFLNRHYYFNVDNELNLELHINGKTYSLCGV